MKYILSIVILFTLNSCYDPFSLGIINPLHIKYSKKEVKRATILSIAAKLEKKYHSEQKNMDHHQRQPDQLSEKSKQIDFLRRIKEND